MHHLKILQSVFKFNYRLKEIRNHFILTVTLNGDLIYHKYMLSWVRYLYEYPFNVFLADAHKVKNTTGFKFESIINLFNLVGATSGICEHGTGIHAKLKELEGGHKQINDIFPVIHAEKGWGAPNKKLKGVTTLEDIDIDNNSLHSSDYWGSEEEFNKRLELYRKNYKILIDYKKK